jgi:hypothetical protein
MWKSRRLTTLWAFTACYRGNFTFTLLMPICSVFSTCRNMVRTSGKGRLTVTHNQLTPWSWALLEKPPVAQLLKNYSLPCSQEPSTCPYPEPHQFSPYHPILPKVRLNDMLFPLWCLAFWLSHRNPVLIPLLPLCVLHALPISSSLTDGDQRGTKLNSAHNLQWCTSL